MCGQLYTFFQNNNKISPDRAVDSVDKVPVYTCCTGPPLEKVGVQCFA